MIGLRSALRLPDPRLYQIATLSALLIFGLTRDVFEIAPAQLVAVFAAACVTQAVGSFLIATRCDFHSAIITALSLSLLLRTDAIWPMALAGALAIGSKFALRLYGKHIFNPATFAIVVMVLFTDFAWTTPGQWGVAIWFAALLAGVGMFVTYRAARIDVPLIFLGVFAILIFGRALYLGDPLSIPMLRLQNGALILFAFFMISDPKTTPDGAMARVAFAATTAIISYILIYHFYLSDGIFLALAAMCLARPLLDWADPAPRYQWGTPPKTLSEIIPSYRQYNQRREYAAE